MFTSTSVHTTHIQHSIWQTVRSLFAQCVARSRGYLFNHIMTRFVMRPNTCWNVRRCRCYGVGCSTAASFRCARARAEKNMFYLFGHEQISSSSTRPVRSLRHNIAYASRSRAQFCSSHNHYLYLEAHTKLWIVFELVNIMYIRIHESIRRTNRLDKSNSEGGGDVQYLVDRLSICTIYGATVTLTGESTLCSVSTQQQTTT